MGTVAARPNSRRPAPASNADRPHRRLDPTEIDGHPHAVEREVCRVLTSQPGMTFSGLVVRRVRDGVCLSGVVETTGAADFCGIARRAAGVNEVINRLIVRPVAE